VEIGEGKKKMEEVHLEQKERGGRQMREFVDGLIGSMIDGCCSGLELPRKMFDFS